MKAFPQFEQRALQGQNAFTKPATTASAGRIRSSRTSKDPVVGEAGRVLAGLPEGPPLLLAHKAAFEMGKFFPTTSLCCSTGWDDNIERKRPFESTGLFFSLFFQKHVERMSNTTTGYI